MKENLRTTRNKTLARRIPKLVARRDARGDGIPEQNGLQLGKKGSRSTNTESNNDP